MSGRDKKNFEIARVLVRLDHIANPQTIENTGYACTRMDSGALATSNKNLSVGQ
jgi:hypothetical protein